MSSVLVYTFKHTMINMDSLFEFCFFEQGAKVEIEAIAVVGQITDEN